MDSGLITFIVVICIILFIGGGGALFLYLKSKPKVISWRAKCYQVGEGIKTVRDENGKEALQIKDLIPYMEDVLIRKDMGVGKTVYELQKLGITTNSVTADMVDVWGKGKREVHVLIEGETGTVMKYGYDVKTGRTVFTPMARERIELITSEIHTKQARLKKDKTNLAALTTWVLVGMGVLGLIGVSFFVGQGFIKSSENNALASKTIADSNIEAARIYRDGANNIRDATNNIRQDIAKLENYKNNNINSNSNTTDATIK